MWNSLKSLSWVVTLGVIAAGIMFALNGRRASRMQARTKSAEKRADVLINSVISTDINKGKRLAGKAAANKKKTADIKKRMKDNLKAMGGADANIKDVATRFNARRVRKRPNRAT